MGEQVEMMIDPVWEHAAHRGSCGNLTRRHFKAAAVLLGVLFACYKLSVGLSPSGAPAGAIEDLIMKSHYSQTASYKCNKEHEDELKQCIEKTNGACHNATNSKYFQCCKKTPRQTCTFPCSETCQQQFGTETSNYTKCCKSCPGELCVDPWKLIQELS